MQEQGQPYSMRTLLGCPLHKVNISNNMALDWNSYASFQHSGPG